MQVNKYIEAYIPVNVCNMKCSYCYLNKNIEQVFCELNHEPEFIAKALNKERLGGPALINLCAAGETTMMKKFFELTKALLKEGHALSIVTNGTNRKYFDDVATLTKELRENLFFKFSLHYFELIRLNMMDVFFDNIQKVKAAGCSFTIELTPADEYLPVKEEIKKLCMEKAGALCHITIPRNDTTREHALLSKYSLEEFYSNWKDFDSPLLDFKYSIWGKKICDFCYAGDWYFTVELSTGNMAPCYEGDYFKFNLYKDIKKKIPFKAVGKKCPSTHCYNGHAFLPLGMVPSMEAPFYTELRDRICTDGSHWVKEPMREILNTKLGKTNKEYSGLKKWLSERK